MAGGGIQNNIRIKALNLCILPKGIPLLLEEDLTYVAVIVVHFQVDVEQLKIFAIEFYLINSLQKLWHMTYKIAVISLTAVVEKVENC